MIQIFLKPCKILWPTKYTKFSILIYNKTSLIIVLYSWTMCNLWYLIMPFILLLNFVPPPVYFSFLMFLSSDFIYIIRKSFKKVITYELLLKWAMWSNGLLSKDIHMKKIITLTWLKYRRLKYQIKMDSVVKCYGFCTAEIENNTLLIEKQKLIWKIIKIFTR